VLYNSNRIERRVGKRLELSLPITLFGQKVKSNNIFIKRKGENV